MDIFMRIFTTLTISIAGFVISWRSLKVVLKIIKHGFNKIDNEVERIMED